MNRRIVIGLLALAVVITAVWILPIAEWLARFLRWTEVNRGSAWTLFILVYVIATVCFVPALPLTLAAGAIFGLWHGFLLVSAGSTLGATAAFFVGRTVARDWVAAKIAAWPRFRALDRSLQSRGFWIVMLTRLSPLFPFFLLNYAYGISAVRPRDYIPASWLGMMPGTLAYVYTGSLAANLAQALTGEVKTGTSGWVLLGVGLIATFIVTVVVTRLAKRELDKEIAA
jgi:uncharacterized membrane protein YdjX (TVP38/TMEM64 family)